MRPLRCLIGLHRGQTLPAHEVDADVQGRTAFVCSRCGSVLSTPTPADGAAHESPDPLGTGVAVALRKRRPTGPDTPGGTGTDTRADGQCPTCNRPLRDHARAVIDGDPAYICDVTTTGVDGAVFDPVHRPGG